LESVRNDGRRTAVVMGASRGLGRAIGERLAADGCQVHLMARSEADLAALAAEIGDRASWRALDVADPQALAEALRLAEETYGAIDVLVCNAGGPKPGGLTELTEQDWADAWHLTLMSTVRAVREVAPGMVRRKHGRIVVVGSSSVRAPIRGLLLSNVYRAGVLALVRTLAPEFGPAGVTINMVAPGRFDTERVATLDKRRAEQRAVPVEQVRAESIARIPVGRYGIPPELASAVAFLSSDEASYITGQCLLVDGGLIVSDQ